MTSNEDSSARRDTHLSATSGMIFDRNRLKRYRSPYMPSKRTVRRYSAFFRGWATAFGSHEKAGDEEHGLRWLFREEQIGLILTPDVKRFLYPLFFGRHRDDSPSVTLSAGLLRIEEVDIPFGEEDRRAFDATMELMRAEGDLHLYQTYHLIYPSGTRILTLSCRAPLQLVYREIAPLTVDLT